jgi:Na+-translocating ferredoxin:NAD+ oxidoreductase RnfG subunit
MVPQWPTSDEFGPNNGGAVAAVYYKDTDTYNLCRYLAAVQQDGYAGQCRQI